MKQSGDEFMARVSSAQGDNPLDEETRRVLREIWARGEIQPGIPDFGVDGKEGLDNGLFFVTLRRENAPAAAISRRPVGESSFWMEGDDRKRHTLSVFRACLRTGLPLVLEGDSTRLSVRGAGMEEAFLRGAKRLGSVGRLNGWHRFEVNGELVSEKCDGRVAQRLLSEKLHGKTWTVDNFEVGKRSQNMFCTDCFLVSTRGRQKHIYEHLMSTPCDLVYLAGRQAGGWQHVRQHRDTEGS